MGFQMAGAGVAGSMKSSSGDVNRLLCLGASALLLGATGVGGLAHAFGQTFGDQPGGGRICCAERRGDDARAIPS